MRKLIMTLLACCACACAGISGKTGDTAADSGAKYEEQGEFSADSAFAYIKAQTDLDPRVPGSPAHARCVDYLTATLERFGADTVEIIGNPAEVEGLGRVHVKNILARFGSDKPSRILLLSHYDSRPWADQEADKAERDRPIDGANDGASGVGVLLEIARNIYIKEPGIGVDILLTDLEDSGTRADAAVSDDSESSWCIGATQFAENLPYTAATMPRYGILLDMVGGKNARFNREYFSANAAPLPTARVWDMAGKLGLSERFPMAIGGAITDDHLPLINAGIQVTDIIESANPATGSFNPTWHTHSDNIDNIDKTTLDAVGRVVLNILYNEKP